MFFLNCISGPLSTIAAPFVLRTVGALSNETTLLFSTLVWCTSLCGVLLGLVLIDRIGRRQLFIIAVIPEACAALFMAIAGPGHPTVACRRLLRVQLLQLARPGRADLGVVERAVSHPVARP